MITTADTFIARIGKDGTIIWSTYYGGSASDFANLCLTDSFGALYLGGETQSASGIATANGFQATAGVDWDAFMAKFNGNNGQQILATYFCGSG